MDKFNLPLPMFSSPSKVLGLIIATPRVKKSFSSQDQQGLITLGWIHVSSAEPSGGSSHMMLQDVLTVLLEEE